MPQDGHLGNDLLSLEATLQRLNGVRGGGEPQDHGTKAFAGSTGSRHINQFYMAGRITAPMVVIELALMGSMYKNKTADIVIVAISVVALGVFFWGFGNRPP